MGPADDIPPPAYFVRSLPIMPTGAWLRAHLVSRGPYAAGLLLAMAAGFGLALGVTPSCPHPLQPPQRSGGPGVPPYPSLIRPAPPNMLRTGTP
ncbi:hypothetical protein [Sphaerisporangium krabiense]|uniref:Uncharacterized protein n=1 Tax=Sphaerisporangium krabiense TaxID=763782 RepID=A0A7W8Z345_9ACTN|nr:hypothetical protein [Sphaerisporangium krabiense]MBB5626355.1 hypothetical protein [Sphaerisporangium krabiense]